MAAKRKKHADHEEHVNHERWLITYADMITLLMVLFIVLYAIGQTDLAKFEALKKSFKSGPGAADTPNAALDGRGAGIADNELPVRAAATNELALADPAAQRRAEVSRLRATAVELSKELGAAGLDSQVKFELNERGLIVTLVTDAVVFAPGSAVLQSDGRKVLDQLAPVLLKLPNQIGIEGHTDDRPISGRYASNWELSTARATSVLRDLVEHHGFPPNRLSAAGYADQRPVVPNTSDANRAANRRVEIVVKAQSAEVTLAAAELADPLFDGSKSATTTTVPSGVVVIEPDITLDGSDSEAEESHDTDAESEEAADVESEDAAHAESEDAAQAESEEAADAESEDAEQAESEDGADTHGTDTSTADTHSTDAQSDGEDESSPADAPSAH